MPHPVQPRLRPIAPRIQPFVQVIDPASPVLLRKRKRFKEVAPQAKKQHIENKCKSAFCPLCLSGFTKISNRNNHIGNNRCNTVATRRGKLPLLGPSEQSQVIWDVFLDRLTQLKAESERFEEEEHYAGISRRSVALPRGLDATIAPPNSYGDLSHRSGSRSLPVEKAPVFDMGGVDYSFPDTRSYYFPQQSFHTTAAPRNISYPSEQHSAASVAGPMLSNSTYRIQPQQVDRPRRAQLSSAASFGGFDLCSRSPNSSPAFFAHQSRMENYVRPALHSYETSPLPNRPISVAPRGPTYRDPSRLPSASFSGCGLPAHSATIFSAQPSWVENRGTSEQMDQQPPHPSRSNVGLQVQNGSLRTLPSAPIGGPSKGHLNQFYAGPLTMQSASTSPVSEAAPAPYDDAAPEVSHLQSQPAPRSFKWIVYAPEDGRCQDLPQRISDSETSHFEPTEVDSAFDIVAGNAVPDKEQSQNTTEGILAEEATHLEEEVESVEEDEQSDEGEKAVDESASSALPSFVGDPKYLWIDSLFQDLPHMAHGSRIPQQPLASSVHVPDTLPDLSPPVSKEAWLINAAWPRDLKAMNTCSVSPKGPTSDDTMLRLPWTPNSTTS